MEKVCPWCGQPSDRGRLRNRTEPNTWFLGPIRAHNPNGISIGSAVIAGLTDQQFLRPNCAPSSECPQFADLWSKSMEWCGRNISGSAHLCRRLPLRCTLRSAGGLPEWQTSKCISSVSFFRIKSNFFTTHRRHRRKKRWTRILKFEFCDFWEFFEIFKKVSRGPSADDLDHYGRGQTRSD